jgi:hypothetical protein
MDQAVGDGLRSPRSLGTFSVSPCTFQLITYGHIMKVSSNPGLAVALHNTLQKAGPNEVPHGQNAP